MLYEFGLQMHHLSKCVSKILSGMCLKHGVYLEATATINSIVMCVGDHFGRPISQRKIYTDMFLAALLRFLT